MALLSIIRLPFRVARVPFTVALFVLGVRHRRSFNLAAAGLNESKAQTLYFTLKRAAATPEEERVGLEWLAGLQVAQVASSRLLAELDIMEANLKFWERRLEARSHFWFSLLRHGPSAFAQRLWGWITFHRRENREGGAVTDVELVEKRVLIFRLLRGELSEAVAAVQRSAALLYLQHSPVEDVGTAEIAAEIAGGAADDNDETLFRRAHAAVEAAMAGIAQAFADLERGVEATLRAQQQGPRGPAAADRPMLTQAIGRVLGMAALRRIWTHGDQLHAAEGDPAVAALAPASVVSSAAPAAAAVSPRGGAGMGTFFAAQQAAGFTPTLSADCTVHAALAEARRAANTLQRTRRLVQLPAWTPMPSQAQQYWVRYAVIGVVASYGAVFMVRHSRLSGSHDLDDWLRAAVGAVRAAWADHVVEPLERVRGELFNTFRRRPAIVSMQEYEADRDSLERMLEDFKKDFISRRGTAAASVNRGGSSGGNATISGDEGDDQLLAGMELMMRSYEQELKRPVRNLVSGDLMRSLLIQVQKLKVDTESAMLEIDQILRANELSISLVAAIPAFLIAGAGVVGVARFFTPSPPDPRREAVPARMAMIEVERSLEVLAASEEAAAAVGEGRSSESEGVFVYRLALAYSEAEELFRRHRGMLRSAGGTEWTNLREDLLELATPAPTAQKLRTAARMMRVYSVYQQF